MKKLLIAAFAVLLSLPGAMAADQTVKSKVETVTLFLRGAQVNRTAKVSIPVGRTKLLFKGLTPDMNNNSISIKLKDATDVKILSVNHRKDYLDELSKDPRVKQLSDTIELMEFQLEDMITELNLLNARERFVMSNYHVKGDQNLDPVALVKVSEFYNKELATVRRSRVKQQRSYDKLNKLVIKYQNQLSALLGKQVENTSVVEVLVETVKKQSFGVTLSFVVNNAGWTPSYDVRASDITKPIEVAYKATMFQNTGIDWKGVKLTFSNDNPYKSKTLPTLNPYYLRFISYAAVRRARSNPSAKTAQNYLNMNQHTEVSGVVLDAETGEALEAAVVQVTGTSIGTFTDANGNFKLEVPNNRKYLQVKYIGYKASSIYLDGTYKRILLESSGAQLSEVVISKKADVQRRRGDQEGYYKDSAPAIADYSYEPSRAKRKALGVTASKAKLKRRGEMYDRNSNVSYFAGTANLNVQQIVKPVSVELSLNELYNVKSSGKPMVIEMKTEQIKADFEYRSIPKLDEAAYLMAIIPDWTKYNFLEAEAHLYFEDTYVGKTVFDLASLSDTLTISLGEDKSIQIARKKEKEFSGRQFIGTHKVDKREFKIEVRNTKSAPIKLVLYDQVPLSNTQDIEVTVSEVSKAKHNKKTGQLTWNLDIKPGEKIEKKINYSVKYPKGRYINLE